MDFDTFLTVASFAGAVISYAIARYCETHVKLRYKDQKAWSQ